MITIKIDGNSVSKYLKQRKSLQKQAGKNPIPFMI
jgi:hypothetical protein